MLVHVLVRSTGVACCIRGLSHPWVLPGSSGPACGPPHIYSSSRIVAYLRAGTGDGMGSHMVLHGRKSRLHVCLCPGTERFSTMHLRTATSHSIPLRTANFADGPAILGCGDVQYSTCCSAGNFKFMHIVDLTKPLKELLRIPRKKITCLLHKLAWYQASCQTHNVSYNCKHWEEYWCVCT